MDPSVEALVPPADATNGLRPVRSDGSDRRARDCPHGRCPQPSSGDPSCTPFARCSSVFHACSSMLWHRGRDCGRGPGVCTAGIDGHRCRCDVRRPARRGGGAAGCARRRSASVCRRPGDRATRLPRWMSRRSYRSARQLGARGVIGVLVLRLASWPLQDRFISFAVRAEFPSRRSWPAPCSAFVPADRRARRPRGRCFARRCSIHRCRTRLTIVTAILLTASAAILRTLLLIRQFAPSVSSHRARAEFG